ncbi:MAG: SMC-Scp complex subunit ScpB [Pseudomonadota bacterium]
MNRNFEDLDLDKSDVTSVEPSPPVEEPNFDELLGENLESMFEVVDPLEISLVGSMPDAFSSESSESETLLASEKDEILEGGETSSLSAGVPAPLEALDLASIVEAILFASPKPLKVGDILEILADESVTSKEVSEVISSLVRFYRARKGGFKLENVRHGYQFQTDPAAGEVMERMFSSRPRPISRAAQETLAIIAYRQPVTRADIEFIRGVDAGSIMKNLLDRNLIKCVGRKEDSGRPMLFGTTDEFLQVYALHSLAELPPLEAFQPSHEIMKNALEAIEKGDETEGPADFVGNYDEQMEEEDLSLEGAPREVEGSDLEESGDSDTFTAIAHDNMPQPMIKEGPPLEIKRALQGATKAKNDEHEARPQGVFLGDLDGGFEDDDNSEEKY